jgi:hypothetical protein
METNKMKKSFMTIGIILLALVFFYSEAFPWGSATHAYIDDYLNKQTGTKNLNEIYGGMAPDIFNYMFDNPEYIDYLYDQTHNEFMKVWEKVKFGMEKALAYGFVSHNDVWGADYTAHHASRTLLIDEGYVITKAKVLEQVLYSTFDGLGLGGDEYYDLRLELCHNLVEAGVDILMKRKDPLIGQKIISSALLRSPEFPLLLVKAYAKDFSEYAGITYLDAVKIITSSEREFRKTIFFYGYALTQDEEKAIPLISGQMADLAESFLGAYGITLPEGTDLTPLITFAIQQSIEICADDFSDEIEATINYVEQQMNANGITY